MSYKISLICLKCSLLAFFLLFLQRGQSQSNWTALDQQVLAGQKTLGTNAVVMLLKDDSVVYKK